MTFLYLGRKDIHHYSNSCLCNDIQKWMRRLSTRRKCLPTQVGKQVGTIIELFDLMLIKQTNLSQQIGTIS